MEVGGFSDNSAFGFLSENGMELDLMDELLDDGGWIGTTAGSKYNFSQSDSQICGPPRDTPQYFTSYNSSGNLDMNLSRLYQGETTRCSIENPPPISPKMEELVEDQTLESKSVEIAALPDQSESFRLQDSEVSRRLWIAPKAHPCPSSPVQERLELAVGYLSTVLKDRHVLIQVWIPTTREGKQVLTTVNQPFSLDRNCESLVSYRGVSRSYLFGVDKDSKLSIGLPGRVFLEKLPEWTPDVRFFRKDEYPRIDYAHQYQVQGSIAVPIFERGCSSCLGVVEFVTTAQKTHYRPELETVCKALEAFDLSTLHNVCAPSVKVSYELYQATVPVIEKVLTSLCLTHKLPLAQTWAPCIQLGKDGCRHSNENYRICVSTVDSACYMANEAMDQFHEACSEHHLFQGQGLVGRTFLTNKPIFASDITFFRKTEYPLAHHARMFRLHAVAAIPVGGVHAGSPDFVLEFFLPEDCKDIERQKEILNSLSIVIQQTCQMLHLTMGQGFGREGMPPVWEMLIASDGTVDTKVDTEESQKSQFSSRELYSEKPSWIAHMIEAQKRSEGVAFSVISQKQPNEKFSLTAHRDKSYHSEQLFSECGRFPQMTGTNAGVGCNLDSSSIDERHSPHSRQSSEKRRSKNEKTINLQVLRQYFAGSLKDAAKSIGVCPTTLKRICRQHGINRWPSRKIKKVGHSLRKLQLVIDSVQGAEGAIQIGTFYKSFPELSSRDFSRTGPFPSSKVSDCSQQTNPSRDSGLCSQLETGLKSPSSSGSQSTDLTTCSSDENQAAMTNISTIASNEHCKSLKKTLSDAHLKVPNKEMFFARSQSHKFYTDLPSLENGASQLMFNVQNCNRGSGFRVKATFGDDKVRFSLQPDWGFTDLQQEIARRFKICNVSAIHLKYLDDEKEWVLLTCDADLEECVDIYRLTQSRTIKLSLYRAFKPEMRVSVGNKVPS